MWVKKFPSNHDKKIIFILESEKLNWMMGILLVSLSFLVGFCFIIKILVLYEFNEIQEVQLCEDIPLDMRMDCYPDNPSVQSDACFERGCCWQPVYLSSNVSNKQPTGLGDKGLNIPFCYYPRNYILYNFTDVTSSNNGINAIMKLRHPSGFPRDIANLVFDVQYESCSRVRITISDLDSKRWRAPFPDVSKLQSPGCPGLKAYTVHLVESDGAFFVSRRETGLPVFDSRNAAPLIFSDQFIQLSTILPSHYLYGLGQHLDGLLLDMNWKRRVFWNVDSVPTPEQNLYGSHPFYLVMEPSGNAHGVFLLNSNAMDIVLQPTPALTFHTIGGILDLYVFLGPSPENVMMQYSEVIGTPFLPPYWSLGYHQCRFGYQTLNRTKEVWQRTRDAGIPFDVQWNDIDYMNNQNDFTYDKKRFAGLPDFVEQLHKEGMHYVIITDPGISAGEKPGTYPPYDKGLQYDIFIKNSTGHNFIGKVWNPIATVWPDFTNPKIRRYWYELIKDFHNELSFDGLWIDMNEPSNFWDGQDNGCPISTYNNPPYLPPVVGGKLYYKTVCGTAKHYFGLHYDVHNIYGFSEAIVTEQVLKTVREERPFIISRSSFPGLGGYAGHWTGDVHSDWFNLWKSIGDMLTTGILGIPMVGADICGFNGNTTESLCNRWMQLGAFYPFSRNHNTDNGIDQDPAAFGDLVIRSSKKALTERYKLLPYLYTLFAMAYLKGTTVARPLFFNYPKEVETYSLYRQFMWGDALMIAPVLEEHKEEVVVYFPSDKWYNWYTGEVVTERGWKYITVNAPLDTIPLFVRGGTIIPCQTPAHTTTDSRKNPFGLVVSLNDDNQAKGTLLWDDGLSINSYNEDKYIEWEFSVSNDQLTSRPLLRMWKPASLPKFGWLNVFGISKEVKTVLVNNKPHGFSYNKETQVLLVHNLNLDFSAKNIIYWKTS